MKEGTPPLVRYATWGSAILGFLILLVGAGTASVIATVKWAAAPIIREESRARQSADSLIVSRLESISYKQDVLAQALQYVGAERLEALRSVKQVEPIPVYLPPSTKVPEK